MMDWNNGNTESSTRLEIVRIYRPTRVVAAISCLVVTLLLIISICPADWVETNHDLEMEMRTKEGLFRICPKSGDDDCTMQDKPYMKAVAALIIITWLMTLAAGVLIFVGICSRDDILKKSLYRVALILSSIAGGMLLIALIVFPVMVMQTLNQSLYQTVWMLGWPYMLDWAALLIDIFAIVLLAIDRNPDETSIREKAVN